MEEAAATFFFSFPFQAEWADSNCGESETISARGLTPSMRPCPVPLEITGKGVDNAENTRLASAAYIRLHSCGRPQRCPHGPPQTLADDKTWVRRTFVDAQKE